MTHKQKADALAKAVRYYYDKNPRAATVDELPMFEALADYEAAQAEQRCMWAGCESPAKPGTYYCQVHEKGGSLKPSPMSPEERESVNKFFWSQFEQPSDAKTEEKQP